MSEVAGETPVPTWAAMRQHRDTALMHSRYTDAYEVSEQGPLTVMDYHAGWEDPEGNRVGLMVRHKTLVGVEIVPVLTRLTVRDETKDLRTDQVYHMRMDGWNARVVRARKIETKLKPPTFNPNFDIPHPYALPPPPTTYRTKLPIDDDTLRFIDWQFQIGAGMKP